MGGGGGAAAEGGNLSLSPSPTDSLSHVDRDNKRKIVTCCQSTYVEYEIIDIKLLL